MFDNHRERFDVMIEAIPPTPHLPTTGRARSSRFLWQAVLVGAALLGALSVLSPDAHALARSGISANCTAGRTPQVGDTISRQEDFDFSDGCDAAWLGGLGSARAVGRGSTTFGFPATANAQSSLTSIGGIGTARVVAYVDLDLILRERAPPPAPLTGIPVVITAPYTMGLSVSRLPFVAGGSGADVVLDVTGSTFDGRTESARQLIPSEATIGDFGSEGALVWDGVFVVDSPSAFLRVRITAVCQSTGRSFPGIDVETSCQSEIDPFFSFDQDTFDLMMGSETFPLADYFQFGVSENLVQPPIVVPAPGAGWLLLASIGSLGGLAARRRTRLR